MKPDIDAIRERLNRLKDFRKAHGSPAQPIIEMLRLELIEDKYDKDAADVYANSQTDLTDLLAYIEQQDKRIAELEQERDAAVEDIKQSYKIGETENGEPIYDFGFCMLCKYQNNEPCPCKTGLRESWEWRGVKK